MPSNRDLLPVLGVGNCVSLARGLAIACLAGFIGSSWPSGGLGWLPIGLAVFCFIADMFDGYLARRSNHVTILGERLDLEFDKTGMLVGTVLAVWYAQLPLWYLVLGLGGHLFSITFWFRQKRNLPVHELPPSVYRRLFAGIQMWAIAGVLCPVLTPEVATFIAIVTGFFAMSAFTVDWLIVCGYLDPYHRGYKRCIKWLKRFGRHWLPVVMRMLLAATLLIILSQFDNPFQPTEWMVSYSRWGLPFPEILVWVAGVGCMLGVPAIAFGILGRFWAMFLTGPIFFESVREGFVLVDAMALGSCIMIVIFGLGRFAMWRPDEDLMNQYIHRGFDNPPPE